jgi:hypothetical protein
MIRKHATSMIAQLNQIKAENVSIFDLNSKNLIADV